MGLSTSKSAEVAEDGAVAILQEEVERLKLDLQNAISEKERAICDKNLQSLMLKEWLGSQGVFDIALPERVTISEAHLEAMTNLVKAYNSDASQSTERNGSIDDERSVHNLWRRLLEYSLMRDANDDSRDSEDRTRVVYEWEINCPRTGNKKVIDFAFTDAACSHLSWLRFRGGIELKKNPSKLSSGKNTGSGTANTLGRRQALSRAATCVYSFLEAVGWVVPVEGFLRAYTCYGDARTFGVARVSVDADLKVGVDVFGPVPLPGFGDESTTDPKTVPRILKHLLTSPRAALRDLISSPPTAMSTVRGLKEGAPAAWELGQILGVGGFALVCSGGSFSERGAAQPVTTVIKTATIPQHAHKLQQELDMLRLLQKNLRNDPTALAGVPRCVDVLMAELGGTKEAIVALRLTPLGVPVPKFLRLVDASAGVYTNLVRLIGPALVSILRAAHAANICHRDVRPSNILIVPSSAAVARIIQAHGDPRKGPEAIKSIDLADCTAVLNDWGEAQLCRGDEEKIKDLQYLVVALVYPSNLLDVSSVSVVRGSSVPRLQSASTTGGRHVPSIATDAVIKLDRLAAEKNYSELMTTLSSAEFISSL